LKSGIKYLLPAILLAFVLLCARIPMLAEWYMTACYPVIAVVISFLTHWFPFSVLDVFVIAAVFLLLGSMVMLCMKRLSFRYWAKIFLLSVIWMAIWFYMAWGIGYFRPDFHVRFGVEPPKEDRDFFETFVLCYVDSLNHACIVEPLFDAKEVDDEIEALYEKHHGLLRLPYPNGWRRTRKTIAESLMTRMGVAGYFGPFFNEVHVNNYSPPITYPYTLAHEKAHQFGIANEAECNLYATVICTSSSHPLVRYSGYLQTTSYLLNNLRKISPDRYREIVEQIAPQVIDDYRAIQEHWQKGLNPTLSAMQDKVYDTYLKTNKQQSGLLSYSEMTGLLVAWEMMKLSLVKK